MDDDKYLDSVYGWAGIMGESIVVNRKYAVQFALHRYQKQRAAISDSDLQIIEGVATDCRPKAAETAFQMLIGSWDAITTLQNQVLTLIEKEKQPDVLFIWTKEGGWKQG